MKNGFDRIPPEVRGLQGGVDAPDLSGAILREVGRRKGWVSRRQRVLVNVARWGSASVVLGVVAGVLLVQRYTPVDEMVSPPEKRALADLLQNVKSETSVAVQTVSTQVRSLPEQLMNQSRQMMVTTARIERAGSTRTIELAEPAVVLSETTGHVGGVRVAAGQHEFVWRAMGDRGGVGLGWPTALNAPMGESARGPVFEAEGLERGK